MVFADAISTARGFVEALYLVYLICIIAYIIASWIPLPYNTTLNRIQRFLYDVVDPYLRLFRRFIPQLNLGGLGLDLSPIVAIITLTIVYRLIDSGLGYERSGVDRLLSDIAVSFEDVWRERADLRDEIERLESELHRQREIEEALRNTLLSAERMADELRARAHREADLIVEEARAKAREIASTAEVEQERMRDEIRRLRALETDVRAEFRAFLASALDRLEGGPVGGRGEAGRDRHQAA